MTRVSAPWLLVGSIVNSFDVPAKQPRGLAWDGKFLWLGETSEGLIYKISPLNGEVIATINFPGSRLTGISWNGDVLWMADYDENVIYGIEPSNGEVVEKLYSPGQAPTGLAPDGNTIWISDENGRIYQFDVTQGEIIQILPTTMSTPRILGWDGDDLWISKQLYFGDTETYEIYTLDPMNGIITGPISLLTEAPVGIIWDKGYLWVADYRDRRIYKLDRSVVEIANYFSVTGYVQDITWDDSNLWYTDSIEDRIYSIDISSGNVVGLILTPGSMPTGLAWDGEHLWHSDYDTKRIYKLDVSTGKVVMFFPMPQNLNPVCMAWWRGHIWLSDREGKVYEIDPSNGKLVSMLEFSDDELLARGLIWDEDLLWITDDLSGGLFAVDHLTGEVLHSFASPELHLSSLAKVNTHLYLVDSKKDLVLMIRSPN